MRFKLPHKALFDFLKRPRRQIPPDFLEFGLAAREVMAARTLRAVTGQLTSTEARRMIQEKQSAAIHAQVAYTEAILNGKAASAPGAYFDVYRRAVAANRKRLIAPRWRRPRLR
jgi:hypothetical protein